MILRPSEESMKRRTFFSALCGATIAVPASAKIEPIKTARDLGPVTNPKEIANLANLGREFTDKLAERAAFLLKTFAGTKIDTINVEVGPANRGDTVNVPIPLGPRLMPDKTGPRAQVYGVKLGNLQIVLDRHIEATVVLPDVEMLMKNEGLLDTYIMPACLSLVEKFVDDAPRGSFLFAALPDKICPGLGAFISKSNRSGFIARAILSWDPGTLRQIATIDVLYGQVCRESCVTVHAIDAKSFIENSDAIASAIERALQQNHPLLGTLRAVV